MRIIPLLLAFFVAAGCAPKDRGIRLARVAGEKKNLEVTLDRLEERLLADQARVRLWTELRDRHESVSAVACASQDEHAYEMAQHALPRSPLHQARIAAALPGPAKPVVRTTGASAASTPAR